jgi:hypothetical protein
MMPNVVFLIIICSSKSLFHCRGTEEADTRVFECPDINGVYLNSDDAFILNTKDNQLSYHVLVFFSHTCFFFFFVGICGWANLQTPICATWQSTFASL